MLIDERVETGNAGIFEPLPAFRAETARFQDFAHRFQVEAVELADFLLDLLLPLGRVLRGELRHVAEIAFPELHVIPRKNVPMGVSI